MQISYFHAPYACSMVSHICLLEAGVPFELKPVSLKAGEQRSATYLDINPKGKVPVLVVDGQAISENIAIISYLDQAFPAANLLPGNGLERIQALSWMSWCASGLHPPVTRIARPANFCDLPGAEVAVKRLAVAEQLRNFALIDRQLVPGQWLFGAWTAVDAYLFWIWRRFATVSGADLSEFTNYGDHAKRMEARPSVSRTLELERQLDPV